MADNSAVLLLCLSAPNHNGSHASVSTGPYNAAAHLSPALGFCVVKMPTPHPEMPVSLLTRQ